MQNVDNSSIISTNSNPDSKITQQTTQHTSQVDAPRSSVDPFSVFNAISSIQLTSVKLTLPECKDQVFLTLVEFLKRPLSRQFCVKVQGYSSDLVNLSLPLDKDKVESISQFLNTAKNDFKQSLKLDAYGNGISTDLCDGLESYLLALSYDEILTRHMGLEMRQDLQLSRKIMLLNADGNLVESIGITLSSNCLKLLCHSIIFFENATTPIAKLSHLTDFFKTITTYLTENNYNCDTDHLLLAIIVFLLKCPPARLITALRFSKLRRVDGQEAFGIVTLEAAINYIFSYNLTSPVEITALATRSAARKEKKNGDVVHDSTIIGVQKTAQGFASHFFATEPLITVGNEAVKEKLLKTVNKNI